jgi:hypothetical protein
MNAPKRIDITPEQLDALLQRVKDNRLLDNDYEIIKAMAETVSYLTPTAPGRPGGAAGRLDPVGDCR